MTLACIIAAVLVTFVSMAYAIVCLIEQRNDAAEDWADEVFAHALTRSRLASATSDFDTLVDRHTELAGEHAQCPVPVVPVADGDFPVHADLPDDVWLELLITRPADGATS